MECRSFRKLSYELIADVDPRMAESVETGRFIEMFPDEGALHLHACSECARHWQGLLVQIHALASLSRISAPRDLEGRVVASFHAGHRQDRIVAQLRAVDRRPVPEELVARLERALEERHTAPPVLDRMVEKHIEDLGRDARRSAQRSVRYGLGGVAALVLVATLWFTSPRGVVPSEVDGVTTAYRFRSERVDSIQKASLGGFARGVVNGFTGGLADGLR